MLTPSNHPEEIDEFKRLIDKYRYDYCRLVYIIFPFGEPGHELEEMAPYDWQMEEWAKMSVHFSNPLTRFQTYRLGVSSGNGAAKTAFGAMTNIMMLYTQRLKARITANTDPQMSTIVWPEYDIWFNRARFNELFFEKFGTSIKAKAAGLAESWRIDRVTWSEQSPVSMSGLHNKGGAVGYTFEEAPGIPANIYQYASGAFTETGTIKYFLAFGNSDDPESKFEQNMSSPLWHSRRIDTRTLSHIDPEQIKAWLFESNGDEDADDFRVRVRGLPRKTSKDSIIRLENVQAAIGRAADFDKTTVSMLPVVLTCDPAWTGGDETCIAYRQGNYLCLLEKYKLDREAGETHSLTYAKLCYWERMLGADAVFIDQGEGTAVYTLAMNDQKVGWYLIAFQGAPTDHPESKMSEYANVRAQMYNDCNKFLRDGGVLDAAKKEWIEDIVKQLCWTKGSRHKSTAKKTCEPKVEIKTRVGQSPDIADALVLPFALPVSERKDENRSASDPHELTTGSGTFQMPEHPNPYETIDADFKRLYS